MGFTKLWMLEYFSTVSFCTKTLFQKQFGLKWAISCKKNIDSKYIWGALQVNLYPSDKTFVRDCTCTLRCAISCVSLTSGADIWGLPKRKGDQQGDDSRLMHDLLVTDWSCIQWRDECGRPMRSNTDQPFESAVRLVCREHFTLEERRCWALAPQLSAVQDNSSVCVVWLKLHWHVLHYFLCRDPYSDCAKDSVEEVAPGCEDPADRGLVNSITVG